MPTLHWKWTTQIWQNTHMHTIGGGALFTLWCRLCHHHEKISVRHPHWNFLLFLFFFSKPSKKKERDFCPVTQVRLPPPHPSLLCWQEEETSFNISILFLPSKGRREREEPLSLFLISSVILFHFFSYMEGGPDKGRRGGADPPDPTTTVEAPQQKI